jgi:hypothetical protein
MFINSVVFEIFPFVTVVTFILLKRVLEKVRGVWLDLKGLKERSDELSVDLVVFAAFKRGARVDRCTAV